MSTATTQQTISAIISTEKELELTINQLLAQSVAHSDISIQGDPAQLKEKYGVSFLEPEVIQQKDHPPTHEPYLQDDFGWRLGFSFAIPFFVCLVVSIFIIADIRSNPEVGFYGLWGAVIGAMLGFFNARRVKRNYEKKFLMQEKKGGFVIWVTTHTPEQHEQVLNILKQHHSKHVIP